ncbi:stalk domain-containing protein [Paenibacillus sacheonensis]|uniref:Copper amine oxidase n=1 Tax=Paenibacillus sacheonensis TaxID=742054 RepID=A0A7X4YWI5_9BACL|nr:stalk domain-containing protein [Paenibacillus sacheonensis]MBM7569088.1 cell wall-associated NlpC family hydrolase [Paenibacillus sacheonensis]NBC72734.1 copper amine oxidase [Paenibacillus sacheonensis]
MQQSTIKCAALALLMLTTTTTVQAHRAHAEAAQPPSLLLDGRSLAFAAPPVIEHGVSFVPVRPIFEAEGAKVNWDEQAQTITATKDNTLITYRLGDKLAYKNGEELALANPGKLINGFSMVPLRFVSELLGNVVQWHAYDRSISISSIHTLETEITYGVNLRTEPGSETDASVVRMLAKGQRIHVIRALNAKWLEVQTEDGKIGFMSAKLKYSNYASPELRMQQADELIEYGASFIGTHYHFGAATDQTDAFDCSSFVKRVFGEVLGIDLPRISYEQAKEGQEVKLAELRKGDLLFFSARGLDIGHVGIYAGDGKILHTYSDKLGVHIEDFDGQWKDRFVTARRVF